MKKIFVMLVLASCFKESGPNLSDYRKKFNYFSSLVENKDIGEISKFIENECGNDKITFKYKSTQYFLVLINNLTPNEVQQAIEANPDLNEVINDELFVYKMIHEKLKTLNNDMIKVLLLRNNIVNIDFAKVTLALIPCCKIDLKEKKRIIQTLLDNGAEIDSYYNKDYTALHLAAYKGDYDLVEFLLQKGAKKEKEIKVGDLVRQDTKLNDAINIWIQEAEKNSEKEKAGNLIRIRELLNR